MAAIAMATGVLVNGSYPVLRRNKIFNGQSAGLEITNGGGGVYEDNEVFDNKAGGICVATGCTPSLVGNAESDNGQLLEDALGSGQCLFGVSTSAGAHCYPMHRFYRLMGGAEGRGVVGGWG
ncbi:MAG: right-handed parallel beta-helix repeat-containing protein [Alphaproteobacteria bacterium]|nr:right-handed parallel beta-helix repeat-containing protein [Alphaproteobacteria bacterium]